jgi:phosphatidylglycerol---prolipoprotein diacylglyceryl transferase
MHPYLIEIFGFRLPTYGVLVATAFLTALWLTGKLAKQRGYDSEKVMNLGLYCAIGGMVGAKLLMILVDLPAYLADPGSLFSLSVLQAAGIFYGGLILALAVAWWYMRKEKLPLLATADLFAPGIALGHAIGRLGCFAAGCCWGTQCDRAWAVTYTSQHAHDLVGVPLGIPLHPSQLYESAAEIGIFAYLWMRAKRPNPPGLLIGLYLVLYGVVRFLVDFVRRQDQANPFGGPFTTAQWISLGLIAFAVLVWTRRRSLA